MAILEGLPHDYTIRAESPDGAEQEDARRTRSLDGEATLCSNFSQQLDKVLLTFNNHTRSLINRINNKWSSSLI